LKKMKLDTTHMLTKSTSPFYGIVPGNAAIPLGSVVLPVTFGEIRENYRTEYIKFEVADFETSYHAILGRPAIAKFMAVPHCRMGLPGPTTSVGTRTDYSVGPWDYPACATRHLMAWSTRTTKEKYSVRKLYMSRTVWKTPRCTRLVLSPYSDL
jgi:hypothetical protein